MDGAELSATCIGGERDSRKLRFSCRTSDRSKSCSCQALPRNPFWAHRSYLIRMIMWHDLGLIVSPLCVVWHYEADRAGQGTHSAFSIRRTLSDWKPCRTAVRNRSKYAATRSHFYFQFPHGWSSDGAYSAHCFWDAFYYIIGP